MFHAGASQLLQLLIAQVIVERGADVFASDVDAADTLIICGERDGNVGSAVVGEGVVGTLDAKDSFVGTEVDFDHHVLAGQLREQRRGVVFVHYVHAVANALGMAQIDGLANVETQTLRWHKARGQLAGMQGDVDLGIYGMQVIHHLHVQHIVAHGDETVFGLDEIDADEAANVAVRTRRGQALLHSFETQQGLREDLLRGEAAQHLVDVANLHLASGHSLRSAAVLELTALHLGRTDIVEVDSNFIAQLVIEERLANRSEIRGARSAVPAQLAAGLGGVAERRGLHQFEILLILCRGAAGGLVDPLTGVGLAQSPQNAQRWRRTGRGR